ncbi:MAG TPA: TA system VapC family ribonuclease toxin [Longimicrobiales bacterium]
MIALDTNILIYAHREEFPEHPRALAWLRRLASRDVPWALPVFTLGEFIRVVTHPRIFDPPTPLEDALAALDALAASPGVRILSPDRRFPRLLAEAVRVGRATGNLAFDAQIAAVCREHGVAQILTRDRDFSRFPWIQIIDLDDDPEGSA